MQTINRLPAVFQTVTEKKFFDATFDQVFSKKDSDLLAGYIGRRNPGSYNPISDFYLPEPSKNRTWWQLEPTAYSKTEESVKSNVFFYEDLLEHIDHFGGNILNQDRLNESEYYSFAPPIDYDMFINYHNYYWIEQGLTTIYITGVMAADIIGKSSYTTPPTADPPNLTFTSGISIMLVDDPAYSTVRHTVENFGGCTGIKLVPPHPDFTPGTVFEFLPWDGSIELSNGRLIDNRFWDALTWETQTQPGNGDYITIERGALDRNAWSRTNKWFHISAINATVLATGLPFPKNATRALRPIIQFVADIELYKAGTQFRSDIDYGFGKYDNGAPILRTEMQGRDIFYLNDEYNISLVQGSLVVFFHDTDPFDFWDLMGIHEWDHIDDVWDAGFGFISEFIYEANILLDGTVDFRPYTSWDTPVLEGDIVFVLNDGPFDSAQRGQSWYYSKGLWQQVYNEKLRINQSPLFLLRDHNGVMLDDEVTYPGSDFNGSEIFSYKVNTEAGATVDPILRFPIVYESLGQSSDIVFQNDLITDRYTYSTDLLPINGYYYYKLLTDTELLNNWELYQPCPCDIVGPPPSNCITSSKQRVIDKFVVGYETQFQFLLSTEPYGYPASPDLIVYVNNLEVKPVTEQLNGYAFINANNRIYVDLSLYLTELLTITQDIEPVVEIQTYTHELLDPKSTGYFQIPQQLEANPTQLEVDEISGSELTQHFASIISNQIGATGIAYGGNTNYRDTIKNRSVGSYILQNTAPLLKSMMISSSDNLSFINGIRFSSDEYTKFKNRYLNTAYQLINQEFSPLQYQNNTVVISQWVEEILRTINVSREFSDAFAYSYMIANGSPTSTEAFTVPADGKITLASYIDLNNPHNAMYLYDVTTQETLLLIDKDYKVLSTNLSIDIELLTSSVTPGSEIIVALYKSTLPAYIPSTPSKIGTYKTYVPRIELDTSYAEQTGVDRYGLPLNPYPYVIIGHDGSKSVAYGDYRDQLLLELERRIYNLILEKFRNQYYLPLRLETVKSGYFRETRYSRQEYLNITESYLNKWSAKNRANYRVNDWNTLSTTTPASSLWKLYNYRMAEDSLGTPLNLPGNWKGIFQYYYDTIYPDTRPWEMLGFSIQPSWWEYEYGPPVLNLQGQEVWTSTSSGAHDMWADLEAGIIRQGPSAIFDPVTLLPEPQVMWARPGLSALIPVDAAGEIISVMTLFDVVFSGNIYAPFDGFDMDWKYGDGSPVEQAWMCTSTYTFNIQEFLFLMRPAMYGEMFWDTAGTELSPGKISPGIITSLGVITPGNLYTDGSYPGVLLTGGVGSGATADIVVTGGAVTSVTLITPGVGYVVDDNLSIAFEPGTGFNVSVASIISAGISSTNRQFVQNDLYTNDDPFFEWMRPKNKDQVVHAELVETVVQIRYGYQRWISDRILFLGMDVGSTFGQKIRTLDVNLANKFAGFTNKDTINAFIEAVSPDATTNSLVIPSTNFEVLLHKGPAVDSYAYSGVIIRALTDGTFVVYGYDLLNSEFIIRDRSVSRLIEVSVGGTPAEFRYYTAGDTYVEGDIVRYNGVYYLSLTTQLVQKFIPSGWKKLPGLPTIGGIEVSYKPISEDTTTRIPYGTILKTPQDVFDFLIGWGAYLESQGWKFDEVNPETNQLSDWLSSAKQYLFWLNTSWGPDASIQLSPLANKATIEVARGYPNDVERLTNGVYTILDKFGTAILPNATSTDRNGRVISVEPTSLSTGGMFFLKITASETEHILIFDNTTSFNDVIYSPLLRARQQRLRFNGFRSNQWYGKMEAPGYLVIGNDLVPNFDTIVESMRYFYDPNITIDNPSLEDLGRRLIGYESKSYLDNLLVANDTQYLFYQGAIRQKGTIQSFDKLFRSSKIRTEAVEIYEEWALKLGDFGNTIEQVSTEFIVIPEKNSGEAIVTRLHYVPTEIGYVKQINILNAETRYLKTPDISIDPPDAKPDDLRLKEPLRRAKAYAILNDAGIISRVDIIDPGHGYTAPPGVTIHAPNTIHSVDRLYSVWHGRVEKDAGRDNIIDIDIDHNVQWTVRPNDPGFSLKLPTTEKIDYDIPNSGYVNNSDVTHQSFDVIQTVVNWGTEKFNPREDDTVWVAKTFTEEWDVYKLANILQGDYQIVADDSGKLYLKTPNTYQIGTQFTSNDIKTDFGNIVALQIEKSQAVAETIFVPEIRQAQATADIGGSAAASATITNGSVTSLTLSKSGTDYVSTPTVTISPPDKLNASGYAEINGAGNVANVTLTSGGVGYTSATVSISPPVTITATAVASIGGGQVTSINVTNGGQGYIVPPAVTLAASGVSAELAVSTNENGQVDNVAITFPGNGYASVPAIYISQPYLDIALVEVTVVNGSIDSIVPHTYYPGYGYASTPTVTISAPNDPGGIQATATATILNTSVVGYTITNAGSGYTSTPGVQVSIPDGTTATAVCTISNGQIDSVTITHPGGGYTNTPVAAASSSALGNYSASAAAVISNGQVVSISIVDPGSNYNNPPTVTIGAPSASAATATAIISPTTGIASINIVNQGSGYFNTPIVTISPANGIQAQANATVSGGAVTSLSILNAGSGYSSTPSVSIAASSNLGTIYDVIVTDPGLNYYEQPTVTVIGDGTGAELVAVWDIAQRIITSVDIIEAGVDYTYAEIIISPPNFGSETGSGAVTGINIIEDGAGYEVTPNVEIIDLAIPTAIPIITAGVITSIDVTIPGAGYLVAPNITITGDGFGATATATITDGEIISIDVGSGGNGYTEENTSIVIDNPPQFGSGAVARAVILKGSVFAINIDNPGDPDNKNYVKPAVVIDAPTNTVPMENYAVGISGPILDGDYILYSLLTLDGSDVTSNDISNYENINKALLFKTMRFRSMATGTVLISGNEISNIIVDYAGDEYINPPTVQIFGNGTGATATAVISNGSVTSVIIDNSGSGYDYATVSFSPIGNPDYISENNKFWVDFGSQSDIIKKKWSVYRNSITSGFVEFRKQEPLIDTHLFENATIFESAPADTALVLLPTFDPFKDVLPGIAVQNISYISLRDPARYNITSDISMFSENVTFADAQVGQLWWDTSTMRYTYYEQPIALDGSESALDNLIHRRQNWGKLFPGSVINVYEWVQSSVPPDEYDGPGIPKDTNSYVLISTSDRFTGISTLKYYFWVKNSDEVPNINNRTTTSGNIERLLQNPKNQGFVFFNPIQQTVDNNSYIFFNIQEILSYRGNNTQITYRLSAREDQEHAQWVFYRENDQNSIISPQFWDKMVDSICGYTKLLPISEEYNGIIIAKDLPWDACVWDVALWESATETTTPICGEVLPVPDPILTEGEKYGIEYRPRQGMFKQIQPARKVFVQSANELLKHIAIRDNDPSWNVGVLTDDFWDYTNWYKEGYEDATATHVFSTLLDANIALTTGKLQPGNIVHVINGTVDGRFILYAVIQINPNVPVLSLEEVGVELSAIKLLDTLYTSEHIYNLSVELRSLLNAFRTKVMINNNRVDQNSLFFSMINYVLSEQRTPNWVFKSSYIYIKDNNLELNQSLLYIPNQIDNIIKYINEAKPYHTHIRDYTSVYLTSDVADGTAIDSYKIHAKLSFSPDNMDHTDPGHWDADCTDVSRDVAWDHYAWDVCPPETYTLSAETFTDSVEQFVLRDDVYTVALTTPDPYKKGLSQLYPYTFTFDNININNPQTIIAPHDIVSIQLGSDILIYGRDYYAEFNPALAEWQPVAYSEGAIVSYGINVYKANADMTASQNATFDNVTNWSLYNTYTIYFYNDPALTLETPIAHIWFNGGIMQHFRYRTERNEVAHGFPLDDFITNVDTKKPLSNNGGVIAPYVGTWDAARWEAVDPSEILSITHVGLEATLTTTVAHGIPNASTMLMTISNITPEEYNGTYLVTITGPNTLTYTMIEEPATDAIIDSVYDVVFKRVIPWDLTPVPSNNILSITHVGLEATLTAIEPHGIPETPAYWTVVMGVTPAEYNGTYLITVTSPTTFTYIMTTEPASDALIVDTYYLLADETISYKENLSIKHGVEFYRNAEISMGTLDVTLSAPTRETYNINEIIVSADSDILTEPAAIPGVIWINGERIEYRRKTQLSVTQWSLQLVRRGTNGTAPTEHNEGSRVFVEKYNIIPAGPTIMNGSTVVCNSADCRVWNVADDSTQHISRPPGEHSTIPGVPVGGLWYAGTTQATFLKDEPGMSVV